MINLANGDNVSQLAYEAAVYREQLRLIQKEIERISITNIDLVNAAKTTEQLKNGEVLVPIGAGSFISANTHTTKILVPVGANYLLEMEKEHASVEINKRIDATKNAVEKLNDEFNKISIRLNEMNMRLNEMQKQNAINKRVDENIGEDYV